MKVFFLLFVIVLLPFGIFAQSVRRLTSEFEYDSKLPLEIDEISIKEQAGAKIHELTYPSLKGGRVTAYLVTPPTEGKYAGVIFLHPGPGNRSTFLDEAVTLAQSGVVSLLIDAPFRRPEPWKRTFNPPKDPDNEKEIYIQTVLDLRRGVDLLLARKGVDPKRIGYVGHSFGATWGGVLAGIDKRIKTFVLIAGRPSLTEWIQTTKDPNVIKARTSIPPDELKKYLEKLAPLDTVRYITRARTSGLFFQFGLLDKDVLPEEAEKIMPLAGKPATVKWYEADHQGVRTDENALRDRAEWLFKQLKIKK